MLSLFEIIFIVVAFLVGAGFMARFANTKFGQFITKIVGGGKPAPAKVPYSPPKLNVQKTVTSASKPASGAPTTKKKTVSKKTTTKKK